MHLNWKFLTKALILLSIIFGGYILYSEYFREENRFRRDVINKLVMLQKGEIKTLSLKSFGSSWRMMCVLRPYQSGRMLNDDERTVSTWIESQKSLTLENMPVALENEWLLVFGSENELVTINVRRNQIHFRGKELGINYRSCWMKEDVVRDNLHFRSEHGSLILKKGTE